MGDSAMKFRKTRTSVQAQGGCFVCHGSDAHWFSKNALALAAKHHDATGHKTWCDQIIGTTYGDDASTPSPDGFAARTIET